MKTETQNAEVTPGSQVFRLTEKEITQAFFTFIFNRRPTEDELERLQVERNESHFQRYLDGDPLRLSLIFKDSPSQTPRDLREPPPEAPVVGGGM